jgi:hypothetical protein
MNPYSIKTRHNIYFKMLALADMLWNENFQEHQKLSVENKATIAKLSELIALLFQQSRQI